MFLELFLSAAIMGVGNIIFGVFEEKTPTWRRVLKYILVILITFILSRSVGRFWTLVWVFGAPLMGLSFHFWWCKKHGIGIFSAEPKEKYYKLRGWDKT